MGRLSMALWGAVLCALTGNALAVDATQVVARDIRKIGNGNCVASVAVRYNEPIHNPWSQQARLLKSSRKVVQCAKAQTAADGLIRDLESDLLLQAQRRADLDNSQVHSVVLADEAYVRRQATSESPLLKILPAGTRINVRSLTPTWYGLTDARGNPTDGFLHYSELAGTFSAPQRILSSMTAACNARLRSKPSVDAPVLQSLRCGQPLRVVSAGSGWYEVAAGDGHPSGQYVHGAVLTPVRNQVQ
ncbi:SH3 domain-containing protein [Hydrocarboniphaga sp.]|uniref:SH3 domain-containing protein n=1 Tax=Hydrocarboniphaga sp. TaxID=2033016 RepID=UPI003D12FE1F